MEKYIRKTIKRDGRGAEIRTEDRDKLLGWLGEAEDYIEALTAELARITEEDKRFTDVMAERDELINTLRSQIDKLESQVYGRDFTINALRDQVRNADADKAEAFLAGFQQGAKAVISKTWEGSK